MPRFPIDFNDKKEIGRTKEKISAIGLGTWSIYNYKRALATYSYAIEMGIDNIDTAEMYGSGRAEKFVGDLIELVGRDRLFITTKLYPYRFRSREEAIEAARTSLRRMGVSYVDLILIHWPDEITSIKEQVRNLEAIAEEGLARYIGVSNFNLSQLSEAVESTRKHEIVVNQIKYSVIDRSNEDVVEYSIRNGISIQAYSPIERGKVANIRVLARIGKKYGKSPLQVALNFLISRPRVIAIPKAERKEHMDEILGSMGWRLDQEHIEEIESLA